MAATRAISPRSWNTRHLRNPYLTRQFSLQKSSVMTYTLNGAPRKAGVRMPQEEPFAVFAESERHYPLLKGFFSNLDEARRHARNISQDQRQDCFVYSFVKFTEVARFRPQTALRTDQLDRGSFNSSPQRECAAAQCSPQISSANRKSFITGFTVNFGAASPVCGET